MVISAIRLRYEWASKASRVRIEAEVLDEHRCLRSGAMEELSRRLNN